MFAIPSLVALIVFIYLRPQEMLTPLQSVPMLYLLLALATFGWIIDLRLRLTRPLTTPIDRWLILFTIWCFISAGIRTPGDLLTLLSVMVVPLASALLIAHAVQSFRAFQAITVTVLCIAIFLAFIGTHQAFAPLGCIGNGEYDGRECQTHRECEREGEPGVEYECEHIGLLGTSSIGLRVRYRGKLQDPNELALVIAGALPFAFALFERKRSTFRALLALGSLMLVATCVTYTQSRGGQLVLLAALGAYFIKRQGWKGVLVAAIVGLPVMMLGGRSGEEAESSSIERLECWAEGLGMLRAYPFIGVGPGQFIEHHYLTAHNAYVLAAAELGFLGLNLFTIILYLCMKIPVVAMLRLGPGGPTSPDRGAADVARTWSMSLIAAWTGMVVGVFFLSFTYHQILWLYFGIIGAFYSSMKSHDDGYEVTFGWNEWLMLVGIDLFLLIALFVYTHLKGV